MQLYTYENFIATLINFTWIHHKSFDGLEYSVKTSFASTSGTIQLKSTVLWARWPMMVYKQSSMFVVIGWRVGWSFDSCDEWLHVTWTHHPCEDIHIFMMMTKHSHKTIISKRTLFCITICFHLNWKSFFFERRSFLFKSWAYTYKNCWSCID